MPKNPCPGCSRNSKDIKSLRKSLSQLRDNFSNSKHYMMHRAKQVDINQRIKTAAFNAMKKVADRLKNIQVSKGGPGSAIIRLSPQKLAKLNRLLAIDFRRLEKDLTF